LAIKKSLSLRESLLPEDITIDSNNTNRKGITNFYMGTEPFRTDYIFASNVIKITDGKIVFDEPYLMNGKQTHLSDHYGVMANIEV
jgi:Metal-dependent hydrolase